MKKRLLVFSLVLMLAGVSALAQTVTGVVTSHGDGSVLPGVSVLVKGTSTGTATDVDGKYTVNLDDVEDPVLVFSFVGYIPEEIEVGSRSTIDVTLSPDLQQLNEVVVTAFGLEKDKKSLGYAVSEVQSEDISTVKQTNVVNSLAGRVPGLVTTQSNGGVGSGTRVILRGNNSLTGNNQPLYVVDGVPIDNSGFGSADGATTANYERVDYGTGISDINPDDIESISVLKGPNAAALYGSRAANGVIMITTKKGRKGKGLGVTYSANFVFEDPLLLPKYQNEYGQGADGNTYTDLETLKTTTGSWGARMDGSDQLYWTGETKPYVAQPDNVENFFETGFNMVNTVAIDGGSDKSSMRISYTNTDQSGIVPNSELKRHNFNVRAYSEVSDKLTIDAKATYFHQEAKNRVAQGTEGLLAYIYTVPRNLIMDDLKDFQGDGYAVNTWGGGSNGNPYWVVNNDINQDFRDRFTGFVKATYEFTDYLSAFVRVGSDQVSQKTERVNQPGHWFYTSGRFQYNQYKTGETNADFLFMFDKQVGGDLNLSINAGGNYRLNTYEAQGITGEDFKIPTKSIVASASNLFPFYTPTQKKKVTSLYGSAELSYNNLVFLNVSARNDWSSALPEDNWSYFYPSASLSFLINEFVDPSGGVFDFWKIRTSWAQVGNDTEPFRLTTPYTLSNAADSYLGLPVLNQSSVYYDPNLKPEQTKSFEIGTEFSLMNNKLYGDFSYYSINSDDLILIINTEALSGYDQIHTNVGRITNKGVEFMLGGYPVKTSNFTWDVSVNFAHNKNSLEELVEGIVDYPFTTTNSGRVLVRATVGGGYGDIYGFTYLRDDEGNLVVGEDGVPQTTSDYSKLGNYQPDWTGGLTNNITYKNLSLRVLIDARIGGELYSGTDAALDAAGVSEKTLEYREEDIVVEGVRNVGDSENPVYEQNDVAITGGQYWSNYSTVPENYIFDQTNIRLREASLMYRLPKSILNSTPFQDVSLGVVGRNLFFLYKKIDNFDPESSYSTSNFAQGVLFYNLPTTRQYGFNVNIKF